MAITPEYKLFLSSLLKVVSKLYNNDESVFSDISDLNSCPVTTDNISFFNETFVNLFENINSLDKDFLKRVIDSITIIDTTYFKTLFMLQDIDYGDTERVVNILDYLFSIDMSKYSYTESYTLCMWIVRLSTSAKNPAYIEKALNKLQSL